MLLNLLQFLDCDLDCIFLWSAEKNTIHDPVPTSVGIQCTAPKGCDNSALNLRNLLLYIYIMPIYLHRYFAIIFYNLHKGDWALKACNRFPSHQLLPRRAGKGWGRGVALAGRQGHGTGWCWWDWLVYIPASPTSTRLLVPPIVGSGWYIQ